MKKHRRFVQKTIQTEFPPSVKKRYPFLKIAMASMTEIPVSAVTSLPLITIVGQHTLTIENYGSVQSYDSSAIRIQCQHLTIDILGCKLTIDKLNDDEIVISGIVQKIEYK